MEICNCGEFLDELTTEWEFGLSSVDHINRRRLPNAGQLEYSKAIKFDKINFHCSLRVGTTHNKGALVNKDLTIKLMHPECPDGYGSSATCREVHSVGSTGRRNMKARSATTREASRFRKEG